MWFFRIRHANAEIVSCNVSQPFYYIFRSNHHNNIIAVHTVKNKKKVNLIL
jgi:hypothetical protein